MKKKLIVLLTALLLTACSPSAPPTAQDVLAKITESGVQINDITPGTRDPNSPLPNSYQEHYVFSIPEIAPKGGQIFICDTSKNCDALYAYFESLSALGGPYYYQSPNGLIVAQLNSGLSANTAGQIESIINSYK